MAVKRLSGKLLLRPEDFSPTDERFKVIGVFNPGAAQVAGEVVLLVRVAQAVKAKREGYLLSPRSVSSNSGARYEIDTLKVLDGQDHRKPLLEGGFRRLAFISHLECVRLYADGYAVKDISRFDELFGVCSTEEYGSGMKSGAGGWPV